MMLEAVSHSTGSVWYVWLVRACPSVLLGAQGVQPNSGVVIESLHMPDNNVASRRHGRQQGGATCHLASVVALCYPMFHAAWLRWSASVILLLPQPVLLLGYVHHGKPQHVAPRVEPSLLCLRLGLNCEAWQAVMADR